MKKILFALLLLISSISFGYTLESQEVLTIRDTLIIGETKEALFDQIYDLFIKEDNLSHQYYLLNILGAALKSSNIFLIDTELTVIYVFLRFEEDDLWMLQ